jgi:hypothetical protein
MEDSEMTYMVVQTEWDRKLQDNVPSNTNCGHTHATLTDARECQKHLASTSNDWAQRGEIRHQDGTCLMDAEDDQVSALVAAETR